MSSANILLVLFGISDGFKTTAFPAAIAEIDGINEGIAKIALSLGAAKLPIKSSFIKRVGV